MGQCCSATDFFLWGEQKRALLRATWTCKCNECQVYATFSRCVEYVFRIYITTVPEMMDSTLCRSLNLVNLYSTHGNVPVLSCIWAYWPTCWKSLDDTAGNSHSIAKHFPRVLGPDAAFQTKAEGQLALVQCTIYGCSVLWIDIIDSCSSIHHKKWRPHRQQAAVKSFQSVVWTRPYRIHLLAWPNLINLFIINWEWGLKF